MIIPETEEHQLNNSVSSPGTYRARPRVQTKTAQRRCRGW